MFRKSFYTAGWLLATLLVLWAGGAPAAGAEPTPAIAGAQATGVVAEPVAGAPARAHGADAPCEEPCVSGCAGVCGHGAVMTGIEPPAGLCFGVARARHTRNPPTEVFEEAEPRPPRLLHRA